MKILKNYNSFIFEQLTPTNTEMIEFTSKEIKELFVDTDILESIITSENSLLKSINAEEVNFFKTFSLDVDSFDNLNSIDELYEDEEFNKKLVSLKYKKTNLEETEESETFIDKTVDIKFFLIHKEEQSELEKPEYIIYQSKKRGEFKWENIKCYKVNEDMRNFYDKLTSKTVEISKGEKKYIYNTSNGGVDWVLQNVDDEDKTFKRDMENNDIKAILVDEEISITIVA